MKWVLFQKRKPRKDGWYFVCAPTFEPKVYFYATVWWSYKNQQWEFTPKVWAEAITHWMKPIAPTK